MLSGILNFIEDTTLGTYRCTAPGPAASRSRVAHEFPRAIHGRQPVRTHTPRVERCHLGARRDAKARPAYDSHCTGRGSGRRRRAREDFGDLGRVSHDGPAAWLDPDT
uniref:Uncharacterized protein n=1 Tax=Oryza sativa subsp. japonica TaxID=39947 RepID=Q69MV5_ORYSJ|nr:hypothetical protein [Oryza sativa Japonica Group]